MIVVIPDLFSRESQPNRKAIHLSYNGHLGHSTLKSGSPTGMPAPVGDKSPTHSASQRGILGVDKTVLADCGRITAHPAITT
jgi:hypothetical protein